MENLSDSPATREQYEEYLRDPASPHGKDYSSKQKAANAASKDLIVLYHKSGKAETFTRNQIEDGIPEGWKDSPWIKAVEDPYEPDSLPRLNWMYCGLNVTALASSTTIAPALPG